MTLEIVTITVYFYGLLNFSGTGTTREVVAPLVMEEGSIGTTELVPHGADIVIRKLKGGCTTLPGSIMVGDACVLTPVGGTVIELPSAGSLVLTDKFKELPSLKTLCENVSGIKPEYLTNSDKYAVRLSLSSGMLDACAYGAAWGSSLLLKVPSATGSVPLKITYKTGVEKTVELNNGATVFIRNRPENDSGASGIEHFGWYYQIAKDPGTCDGLPTAAPPAKPCPPAFGTAHRDHDAASGLGCSNSTYP